MLKKSIGVGLLCLTSQAYANIQVTTTQDVLADDKQCSLREAVTYVTQYLTAPTAETEEQKKQREEKAKQGYMGCGGEGVTNIIYLEKNTTYELAKEIEITVPLTITTQSNEFSVNNTEKGLNNATIRAIGNHRLFNIDDKKAEISQINVVLSEVNLKGCGLSTICEDRGGIIFNREALSLNYVKFDDGFANEGGAIYNEGLAAGANSSSAGVLNIKSAIFNQNKAKTGAAIFVGQPLFSIENSVFRANEVTNNNGMIIYSETAFDSATTSTDSFTRVSKVVNSVLLKNKGYLINLRDGVYLNNITAVDNSKGIYFHAPMTKAHISNSILAGNNGQDCDYAANDRSLSLNNLVGQGCRAGEVGNLNTYLGNQKLFAGKSSEETICDRPPAEGLLCPYVKPEKSFLGFLKPRLLSSYNTLNDSPIVNRGRIYSDGSAQGIASCEGTDIRGFARDENVHCDIGSFEIMISSDSVTREGKDLKYGEIAELNIAHNLGDGELLPANECEKVLKQATAPNGSPWQVGCLRIDQSSVTPNSKGKVILDADGNIQYIPSSNWHGLDEFNARVVTTASRFSDADQERDVTIPFRIVQSPPNNFSSDTIDTKGTSGGAFGIVGIISLLGLGLLRRKLK